MSTNSSLAFTRLNSATLLIHLSGCWKITDNLPDAAEVFKHIESDPDIRHISFDTHDLTEWDSSLLTFLIKIIDQSALKKVATRKDGLPPGVQRLLTLARADAAAKEALQKPAAQSFLYTIGSGALVFMRTAYEMLDFLGEVFLAFTALLRGKARLRGSDLLLFIQDCGARALPIISLISVLVGLILAFVGAVQLRLFGAQIYVADLVGIAMVREMGAMMVAIIMAGRTGAAFAAQIGTMQTNEEVDALVTMGISPVEFLVVPRMLALVLMMPLLCLYADFMGILGGTLVGVGMLDLSFGQYFQQTKAAISLTDISLGVAKSTVFGLLVALAGCLKGMQCGRSASAVGSATTSAVVTAIVAVIVSDGIFAVITDIIGI